MKEEKSPHPEPFQKAPAALSILPEAAAGIGDTRHDVLRAHGAGRLTIAACVSFILAPSSFLRRGRDGVHLIGYPG
jgi:phosphoglycolate phosphatase-like HAD superfamily hydrolase